MRLFNPDAWSGTHLFGSYFLANFLLWCGVMHGSNIAVALLMGVFWEILDEIYAMEWNNLTNTAFWDRIFDKRGFDVGDIICDAIGVTLAIWI